MAWGTASAQGVFAGFGGPSALGRFHAHPRAAPALWFYME